MNNMLKELLKQLGFTDLGGDFIGSFFDEHSNQIFNMEVKEGTDPTNGLIMYRVCKITEGGVCDVDSSLSIDQFMADLASKSVWAIPEIPSAAVTLSVTINIDKEDVMDEDWVEFLSEHDKKDVGYALIHSARKILSMHLANYDVHISEVGNVRYNA